MSLKSYPINEYVGEVLERYSEDNNTSPSFVIENLLENFLYEKHYIQENVEAVTETPAEIYSKRRSKFVVRHRTKTHYTLEYDGIYFGMFRPHEIDTVIDKLLDFSDNELKELDRNKWEYPMNKYAPFLRQKLNNPFLTVEEFFEDSRIVKSVFNKNNSKVIQFKFDGRLIAQFKDGTPQELIDALYVFVKKLSDDELNSFIDERIRLKVNSAKFLLKYMEDYNNDFKNNDSDLDLPYTILHKNGTVMFQRKGFTFGTHKKDKAYEVWDFLDSKDWDKKYSTKVTGLSRKKYLNWLYTQIENEKGIL